MYLYNRMSFLAFLAFYSLTTIFAEPAHALFQDWTLVVHMNNLPQVRLSVLRCG